MPIVLTFHQLHEIDEVYYIKAGIQLDDSKSTKHIDPTIDPRASVFPDENIIIPQESVSDQTLRRKSQCRYLVTKYFYCRSGIDFFPLAYQ